VFGFSYTQRRAALFNIISRETTELALAQNEAMA